MIVGIDPGINVMGYGLIKIVEGNLVLVDYGTIKTSAKISFPHRLKKLYDGISEIIKAYKPEKMAIEEAFYHKNVRVAMTLGHARATAILASVNNGVQVWEYSPLEIKQSVVGSGSASKEQVQFMVKAILGLDKKPIPYDASDALAVAICHYNRSAFNKKINDFSR